MLSSRIFFLALVLALSPSTAHAYIDPGAISWGLQILAAAAMVIGGLWANHNISRCRGTLARKLTEPYDGPDPDLFKRVEQIETKRSRKSRDYWDQAIRVSVAVSLLMREASLSQGDAIDEVVKVHNKHG